MPLARVNPILPTRSLMSQSPADEACGSAPAWNTCRALTMPRAMTSLPLGHLARVAPARGEIGLPFKERPADASHRAPAVRRPSNMMRRNAPDALRQQFDRRRLADIAKAEHADHALVLVDHRQPADFQLLHVAHRLGEVF